MPHRHWMAVALALSILACAAPRPGATESRPSLTVTFLGVAGWSLSDGTHTLLVGRISAGHRIPQRHG